MGWDSNRHHQQNIAGSAGQWWASSKYRRQWMCLGQMQDTQKRRAASPSQAYRYYIKLIMIVVIVVSRKHRPVIHEGRQCCESWSFGGLEVPEVLKGGRPCDSWNCCSTLQPTGTSTHVARIMLMPYMADDDWLTDLSCSSIRADELAGGVPVFLALPASMFKSR